MGDDVSENIEKKYTPILPFDGTQMDNFQIYDNVKYTCKIDFQRENVISVTILNRYASVATDDTKMSQICGIM